MSGDFLVYAVYALVSKLLKTAYLRFIETLMHCVSIEVLTEDILTLCSYLLSRCHCSLSSRCITVEHLIGVKLCNTEIA